MARKVMRDTQGCTLVVGDIVWPRYHSIKYDPINDVEARITEVIESTEAGIRVTCKVSWVPHHLMGKVKKGQEFVTYDSNLLKLDTSWTEDEERSEQARKDAEKLEQDFNQAMSDVYDDSTERLDDVFAQLEEIDRLGYYDHPDLGRIEPDHPESPMVLLGLM